MTKPLRRVNKKGLYYYANGEKVLGAHKNIFGDVFGLDGDVSYLRGDASGLMGDLNLIPASVRPCNIEDFIENEED